jgi:hypothetical protein
MSDKEETIGELIEKKRAAGYDPEFEARLAKIWLCPNCQRRATILELLFAPNRGMACPRCLSEEIEPIDGGNPDLSVIVGGKPLR